MVLVGRVSQTRTSSIDSGDVGYSPLLSVERAPSAAGVGQLALGLPGHGSQTEAVTTKERSTLHGIAGLWTTWGSGIPVISRDERTGRGFCMFSPWVLGHPDANCSSTLSSGFFTGARSLWISVYGLVGVVVEYVREAGKRGKQRQEGRRMTRNSPKENEVRSRPGIMHRELHRPGTEPLGARLNVGALHLFAFR